jgi:lipid A 4'-phosphatase
MTEPSADHPSSASFLKLFKDERLSDPIVRSVVFIVGVSFFFLLFPRVDLWFSDLFYVSGQGFPASKLEGFIGLRNIGRWATRIVPTALVAVVAIKLAWPERQSLIPQRYILFLLATVTIGSGLIVNLFFKGLWGRPRPTMVGYFHGETPFIGVWEITDYCKANCSFISGEASTAVWLIALTILFTPRWRPTVNRILLILAFILSFDRIVMGGHFLSDVLLAWGFMALTMTVGYRYLVERPPPWLSEEAHEGRLTRWGLAIRKAIGRERGDLSPR